MRLSINQVRDEKEGGGIREGRGRDHVELSFTPPVQKVRGGGVGCVYGAVSHKGRPVPGDAGHQGDEKIIDSSVRACGDKV